MDLKQTVELYHNNGAVLTPLNDKIPTEKNWQNTQWTPELNAKLLECKSVGWVIPKSFVVIDVDNHGTDGQKLGTANLGKMSEHYGYDLMANAGVIVNTAGGGLHLYYRKPEAYLTAPTRNSLQDFPSVEFKSVKRQVVIPNSKLSDGRTYSFHTLSRSFEDIEKLPENIMLDLTAKQTGVKLIKSVIGEDAYADVQAFKEFLGIQTPSTPGDRSNNLYIVACFGKDQGLSEAKVLEMLLPYDEAMNHPPIGRGRVTTTVHSAFTYSKNKEPVTSIAAQFPDNLDEKELEQITNPITNRIKALSFADFLSIKLPPREYVIEPIFPTQGLMMIYAKRGIGKTYFALHLACSIAGGFNIFGTKWNISKSRRVLYIDGEMPANTMQERLSGLLASLPTITDSENLYIINPDHQHENQGSMPDLSEENGQRQIEEVITAKEIDVIIIDNLSTLCRTGKENESESWSSIGQWALKLRTKGKSIIFIHHAGKNDNQRGNSKKEDILDTVIKLKRPDDYQSNQGARFEIHFEKSRGFAGDGANPFEVNLKFDDNKAVWQIAEIEDSEIKRVLELHREGLNQRE